MDVCLPTELHVYQFIDSSIYGCEEFEIFLILFFLELHGFPVFVPVLYIVLFSCNAWHAFTWCANKHYDVPCHLPDVTFKSYITWHLTCSYLTLASCYDMAYHLLPDILILDLWLSHLREYYTCSPVLHTVTRILYLLTCIIHIQWPESIVLMYSWIPDHVLHLLFP